MLNLETRLNSQFSARELAHNADEALAKINHSFGRLFSAVGKPEIASSLLRTYMGLSMLFAPTSAVTSPQLSQPGSIRLSPSSSELQTDSGCDSIFAQEWPKSKKYLSVAYFAPYAYYLVRGEDNTLALMMIDQLGNYRQLSQDINEPSINEEGMSFSGPIARTRGDQFYFDEETILTVSLVRCDGDIYMTSFFKIEMGKNLPVPDFAA